MKKIVVLDDDEAILAAIKYTLESEGHVVIPLTRNGRGLLNQIKKGPPDLIILDVLLSGQDGRDICKKLKSEKTTRGIPVIMISAHPDAEESARKAGADDFLEKPFDIDDLLSAVARSFRA
jgi:DNA-binding response OmpR family regulator